MRNCRLVPRRDEFSFGHLAPTQARHYHPRFLHIRGIQQQYVRKEVDTSARIHITYGIGLKNRLTRRAAQRRRVAPRRAGRSAAAAPRAFWNSSFCDCGYGTTITSNCQWRRQPGTAETDRVGGEAK
eukprot:5637250-Pleurochrysis_carterae.AAC.5